MKAIKYQITSESAYQWVSKCEEELYRLNQYHQPGQTLKKYLEFPGNILAEIIVTDYNNIIRMWGEVVGFICHPRSDEFLGGLTPNDTAITQIYTYPLVDNDKGSFVLTSDELDTSMWVSSRDVENYGNLDWTNEIDQILTWRGPAGRQIPMDATQNYPGFTNLISNGSLLNNYYTPYSNILYQSGDVLKIYPNGYYIVGAALLDTNILAVLVNGNLFEVWCGDIKIGQIENGSLGLPWFFNAASDKIIHQNTLINITKNAENIPIGITSEILNSGSGAQQLIGTPKSSFNLSRNGLWFGYRDFKQNEQTQLVFQLQENQTTSFNTSTSTTYESLLIKIPGQVTGTVTISGPDVWTGDISDYSASVDAASCSVASTTIYPPVDNCGLSEVTASAHLVGGGTLYGTKQVRMSSGQWVYVSTNNYCGTLTHEISPGYPVAISVDTAVREWGYVRACTNNAPTCDTFDQNWSYCAAAGCSASVLAPGVISSDPVGTPCPGKPGYQYYWCVCRRNYYTWEC